jgi:hypothetical protein
MTQVLRLSLPLTVWIVAFSGVYGLHGLVCALGWGAVPGPFGLTLGRAVLIAAWALAILAQAALLAIEASPRHGLPRGFPRTVTITLAIVALVAAIWTLFPVAALSLCAAPEPLRP